MRTFTMDDLPIRSPLAFREHFSPEDILRDPKLAAAFALHNLAPLSEWDRFNSDMLFACAFCWEDAFHFPPQAPLDYFASRPAENCARASSRARMLELREEEQETRTLLARLWNMACRINDSVDVRKRIFCIMAASYFLAQADWQRHPITPEAALSAFRRESRTNAASDVLTFPSGDGPLLVPASRRPYRLVIHPNAPVKKGLSVQKVVAAPHLQGGNVPVMIDLCRYGLQDVHPVRMVIPQGDYRYFLLADGVPVRDMPVLIRNGDWTLSREGSRIRLYHGDRLLRQTEAEDVISMCLDVLDAESAGWVAVTSRRRVDHRNHPHGYSAFGNWEPENVLEAAVDRGEWWVLTDEGIACSQYGKIVTGVTGLRGVIRKTAK